MTLQEVIQFLYSSKDFEISNGTLTVLKNCNRFFNARIQNLNETYFFSKKDKIIITFNTGDFKSMRTFNTDFKLSR